MSKEAFVRRYFDKAIQKFPDLSEEETNQLIDKLEARYDAMPDNAVPESAWETARDVAGQGILNTAAEIPAAAGGITSWAASNTLTPAAQMATGLASQAGLIDDQKAADLMAAAETGGQIFGRMGQYAKEYIRGGENDIPIEIASGALKPFEYDPTIKLSDDPAENRRMQENIYNQSVNAQDAETYKAAAQPGGERLLKNAKEIFYDMPAKTFENLGAYSGGDPELAARFQEDPGGVISETAFGVLAPLGVAGELKGVAQNRLGQAKQSVGNWFRQMADKEAAKYTSQAKARRPSAPEQEIIPEEHPTALEDKTGKLLEDKSQNKIEDKKFREESGPAISLEDNTPPPEPIDAFEGFPEEIPVNWFESMQKKKETARAEEKPSGNTPPLKDVASEGINSPEVKQPPASEPVIEETPLKQSKGIYSISPKEILADPKRFQYKTGVNREGVTDLYKGVEYDPKQAGILTIWQDPKDGKYYIIDGHHRLDMALTSNYPTVDVRLANEYGINTEQEARIFGALKNIGDNRGTAFDAAKIFKELNITNLKDIKDFKINPKTNIAKQGFSLSKLSDLVWEGARNNVIPEELAAQLGNELNHTQQNSIYKEVVKYKNKYGEFPNKNKVNALIDSVKNLEGEGQTEVDMFGDAVETQPIWERASVIEYIQNELGQDKRTFKIATNKNINERLETSQTGKLNKEKGEQQLQTTLMSIDMFNKMKDVKGDIADILNDAAKRIANGENKLNVEREALSNVKSKITSEYSKYYESDKSSGETGKQTPNVSEEIDLFDEKPKTGPSMFGGASENKQPWEMTKKEFNEIRPNVDGYLFHGSPNGDLEFIDPYYHTKNWREGIGFYTTTSRDQALTYARGRTSTGDLKINANKNGKINYIKGNPIKPLNMDSDYDSSLWNEIANKVGGFKNEKEWSDLDMKSNSDAYRQLINSLQNEGFDEAQYDVDNYIRELGYDAYQHFEGKKSSNPHLVTIWNNEKNLPKIIFPFEVHKESVEKALSEGKSIPSEVLSEYPELKPKTGPSMFGGAQIQNWWDKLANSETGKKVKQGVKNFIADEEGALKFDSLYGSEDAKMQSGYDKARDIKESNLKIAKELELGSIDKLMQRVYNRHFPVIKEAEKLGDEKYRLNTDDLDWADSTVHGFLRKAKNQILSMKKSDVSIDDFGKFMELKHITENRDQIKNPVEVQTAEKMLQSLEQNDPNKFKILDGFASEWGRTWQEWIVDSLKDTNLLTPELEATLKQRKSYVPMSVVEHLNDATAGNRFTGASNQIFSQKGTEKEVENPFEAAIYKGMALIRIGRLNKTVLNAIDTLKQNPNLHITPAEKSVIKNSAGKPITSFIDPKQSGQTLVTVMREGKKEGYYVPDWMANSFDKPKSQGLPFLGVASNLFTNIITQKNPYFSWLAFGKDLADQAILTGYKAPKAWYKIAQNFKTAFNDIIGKNDPNVDRMYKAGVWKETKTNKGFQEDISQPIDRVFENFDLDITPEKKSMMRNWLGMAYKLNQEIFERASKAGMYDYYLSEGLAPQEAAYSARRSGSPSFSTKGMDAAAMKSLMPFWNPVVQSLQALTHFGKQNPGKILTGIGAVASLQAFQNMAYDGQLDEYFPGLSNRMKKLTQQQRDFYINIPYDKLEPDGKSKFIRIPVGFIGTFVSKIFNSLTRQEKEKILPQLTVPIVEEIPAFNPMLKWLGQDLPNFLKGNEVTDNFRNRPAYPDELQQTGLDDMRKWAAFAKHTWNTFGGGSYKKMDMWGTDTPKEVNLSDYAYEMFPGKRYLSITNAGEMERIRNLMQEQAAGEARRKLNIQDAVKGNYKPDRKDLINTTTKKLETKYYESERNKERLKQKPDVKRLMEAYKMINNKNPQIQAEGRRIIKEIKGERGK